MKRFKGLLILLIAAAFVFTACNLDSSYGVLQQKFNATASNALPVHSVLGYDGDSIIFVSNGGIYSTDGKSYTKLAAMTSYNIEDLRITPLFSQEKDIFFMYYDKDNEQYSFFKATADDLDNGIDKQFITDNSNSVNYSVNGQSAKITAISSPSNFDLSKTYILYNVDGDNKDIKHYGVIDHSTTITNNINITGDAEVHAASRIIGDGIVRTYIDDSDLYSGDLNQVYVFSYNSDPIKFPSGDYDNLIIGGDGEYLITLDGDLYNIETKTRSDFVNDLIYRVNDIMPVLVNSNGDKIGYLYEGGIYFNPSGSDTAPVLIGIRDDNDLITAAWIGQSGDDYLMYTKENGLWIVTITKNDTKYTGSIHQYDPQKDGAIPTYININ